MKLSIYEFLLELQSFSRISAETMESAEKSNTHTTNNEEFRYTVNSYADGGYDDDLDTLVQEAISYI